jgi:ParB family chromosome partitioning protein
MQVINLPTSALSSPEWNANEMDPAMSARLYRSIEHFGLVIPLVVRNIGNGIYQTIGGAQRLRVLKETGPDLVPCVVVQADDIEARLLSQSLNRIAGSDNLGLRAQLLREVLQRVPQGEVLALLPESQETLKTLSALGQADLAQYLQGWQQTQGSRLKHMTIQLSPPQAEVVEAAFSRVMAQAKELQSDNPNPRGNALYLLCKSFLEQGEKSV